MTDYSALIGHAGAAAVPYRFRPPRVGAGPLGFHPGKNSGSSIDFHDYRSYQPGDDLRRV
ncbi:MAG: hypothetical protein GY765_08695, partial [bacterium]|nr:hypothetical protein [bacterium]